MKRYWLFALGCAVLGLALRYDSLLTGFAADDYAQLDMLEGRYPVERQAWDLFNFSNGTREDGARLHQTGFYYWFAHPQLRLSMYRPLASYLIALDHALFGDSAVPYHVHTSLWWAGMLLAIAWLFARLLPPVVAALALLFYTVDETHTVPIAWLANRCAISSTLFAVLALIAYVRFREQGARRDALLAGLALCFALGFGEYGLCGVPYAFAYEVSRFAERRKAGELLAHGLLAFLPIALPALVYLVVRHALGHGPLHSGIYISPDRDLGAFFALVAARLPVLLADLVFAIPAEMWTFGSMWSHLLLERGWVGVRWVLTPEPWRFTHSAIGVLAVPVIVGLYRAVPRLTHLSWLVWGSVLSIVPVVGSFPSSRVLLMPAIGFAALLAAFVVGAVGALRGERSLRARALGALACALAVYHLAVPAYFTYADSAGMRLGAHAARKAVLGLDVPPARIAAQRVIQLAAREYGTSCMYIPIVRDRFGMPRPKACWTLSLTPAPHMLLRESASAFRLAPMNGFSMLATAPEELLSDPQEPFKRGRKVDLGGLMVTVLGARDGRVHSIRVKADRPLDDPSFSIVTSTHEGIRRFQLPAIGESAVVPVPVVPAP